MNLLIDKHHPKLLGDDFLRTLKGWMTPEVPTGPKPSSVDTTPLPVFFVTRCHLEHHGLYFLGISLCYGTFGNTSTVTKHIGTHT